MCPLAWILPVQGSGREKRGVGLGVGGKPGASQGFRSNVLEAFEAIGRVYDSTVR